MKNKEYKLNFDVWKENFSPWTSKDIEKVVNTIRGCRVGTMVTYKGTSSVRFDEEDEKDRWYPIIEPLQELYDKKNSKIIVFDADESVLGYDKLFIYHYTGGSKGHAGFYFYSSKDSSKHVHRYYLDNESGDITINLNRITYNLSVQNGKR